MRPEYEPRSIEQKLGYLVEECGEVLQAVGKTQRWGMESTDPTVSDVDAETNREWVLRELVDLEGAIVLVRAALLHMGGHTPESEPAIEYTLMDAVRASAGLPPIKAESEPAKLPGPVESYGRDLREPRYNSESATKPEPRE